MADLNAAASAAGLSDKQKKQIERLNKALETHKTLLNLPATVASDAYNTKLTPNEQQDLKDKFGEQSPEEKPNRGWLGTAWHYTGGKVFEAAGALSDIATRVARTGIIALEEGRNLSDAWDRAEKDGQKVFNEERIADAESKYGKNLVSIAKKIRGAKTAKEVAELMATASEEEKYWLQISDRSVRNLPGADAKKLEADRDLLDDAISAVNAAQYSPGRAIANAIDAFIPGDFYKNGFFYKVTSGAVDAAYRIFADPLLVVGKAKRLYDVNKYAYEAIVVSARKGGETAAQYFAKPETVAFWDTYGKTLKNLREATQRGDKVAAAKARKEAERLAPEFGPAVINLFNKTDKPIEDIKSAQAFFENSDDVFKMMNAGTARRRILMPRLDTARKARIKVLTGANRVFNLDDIGPQLVDDFFGAPETQDGIYKAVTEAPQKMIEAAKGLQVKGKDRLRFSSNDIARRIDNAKRKFTRIPLFRDDTFDVTAADAPDKIYQLAALVVPTRQARLMAETFSGLEETGKRKEFFYGLYATIADIRGMNMTVDGQKIVRRLTGKGQVRYSIAGTDDYIDFGLLPSEMNNFVTAPSLVDIDRASSRISLVQRLVGVSNSRFMESTTNAWSFLTLAGPRYAIRNSIEDLMVNIAIGNSPWGIAKNRYLATRLQTAMRLTPGLTAAEKFASEPLGLVMRIVNKSESEGYAARIKDIDKTLSAKKAKIAEYNNIVNTSTDAKKVKGAQAGIRRLRKEIEGGVEQEVRKIMAEALTAGRVQRFAKRAGLSKLDSEGLELLTEQVIYGDIDNLLSIISEGGFNFASGSNYIDSAFNLAKTLGVKQAELRLDLSGLKTQYAKAQGARGFTEIGLTPNNEASMIAWALRISFYGNDELGSIALANADRPVEAVNAMKAWLSDPKNKKVLDDARLSSGKDLSIDEYAQIVLNRARAIVVGRNGEVNTELLNKIRSLDPELGRYTITGKLSLDDLPEDIDLIPASVVGPELVPVADVNNYTSPLMQKGWVWLGLSTARLSRQPMALYEVTKIRKQMKASGFEQAFYDNFTKGIDDAESKAAALVNAKREYAKLVEERAVSQILPYVDNPLIRSQVSFTARNFARFYRAQEDFYRRLARIVRYNPEAIQKLSLTFDGVAHSGWIQEDDRGEKYFVYPHFAPGYRAVQGALTALGIPQDFKVPFPVQFGASVKMLSPSLNTESWLPTFSGPAAAIPMTAIQNLTNIFEPGMGDTIARYTLGEYSVDQGLVSRLMPAHVNRALSAMSQDERNGQYASAYRKAVTYLEAAGHGIPKRYDADGNLLPPSPGELEAYRERARSTTLSILATRFVFGFFAPASPSIQLKSDMQEWIRDAGQANFKQSFNALREQYDGDYDAAMKRWVELFPNAVPYTVTESERKTVAFFGYAEESGKFVSDNETMFKEYPQAAAFLIPHKGAFSFDAYRTMATMGLRTNKRVEEYLREVQTSSDLQIYYQKRDEYENTLKISGSDFARSLARQQFNDWKSRFFAGRPLVQEELNQGAEKRIKTLQALDDLEKFLDDPTYGSIRKDTQDVLRQMVKAYSDYKTQREIFELTGMNKDLMQSIKDGTITSIKELSKYNENTQAAYDVLFGRLLDN